MSEQLNKLVNPEKVLEDLQNRPPKDPFFAKAWAAFPANTIWTDYQMPNLRKLVFLEHQKASTQPSPQPEK